MARKTDGEKIDELEKHVATLIERVSKIGKEAEVVNDEHSTTALALADLRREYDREIALLKREIEELKRGHERWGQRLWMIIAPLIAGAVGVFLAYYLGLKK